MAFCRLSCQRSGVTTALLGMVSQTSLYCVLVVWSGISGLVLWEPKHGKWNVRRQAHTFVDLLEADTVVPRNCLPAVMDDRVGWRKSHEGSTEVNLVVVVVVQCE